MPKRIGYRWEAVVTDENCIAAVREMLRGKKRPAKYAHLYTPDKSKMRRIVAKRLAKPERYNNVVYYRRHVEEIGRRVAADLRAGTWTPRPYRERRIFDELRQKWRSLKVPCLYDQCVHHAVMRQTIPDIMARGYYYDCGSVPNAGQSRAVDALRREMAKPKPWRYAASMDVHHFFDSCGKEAVMRVLRRLYKDRRFLALHERILDSMGGGLAIGFFPSPWYGNLVLRAAVDQPVKQGFARKSFYVRYVDDMALCGNNKRQLHRIVHRIMDSLAAFGLKLKPTWQVYPIRQRGIAFLSYRFFPGFTLVRKKIMYRIARCAKRAAGGLTPRIAMAMMSYKGILKRCNSYHLRKTWIDPYVNFKKCRRMIRYVASLCLPGKAAACV